MKLPVNYGNFLLKKDSDKARFQHNNLPNGQLPQFS